MKILFDQNIPWGPRKPLDTHDISRVWKLGWAELRNGDLLNAAEQAGFQIFLTGDQQLRYQQNLSGRRIAILELTTVHWPTLQLNVVSIVEALNDLGAGAYRVLKCRYSEIKFPIVAKF